jgi:hypothetical protein
MSVVGQLYSLRGTVRIARFRLRRHRPSLDRAIGHLERSAARLEPAHPDRSLVLATLSNALVWRYELTNEPADLDAAVDRLREAIAAPGASPADRSSARGDLAAVLRARFVRTGSRTGSVSDLDEAVEAATDAIRHGDEMVSATTNRALALLARYEHTARFTDLLAALRDARTPVHGAVAGALHRGLRLGVLIDALSARYRHTGDPEDLAAAIAAGREALATLSRVDPNRALYASALSTVLRLSDDPARLDEAIAFAEEAVTATPEEHADHANRLSELSMAVFMRGDDLPRAREIADRALAAATGNRPMLQQRVALMARATSDPAARAHAERAVRDALTRIGPGHPMYTALVCELMELGGDAEELLADTVERPGPTLALRPALRAATLLAGSADTGRSLLGHRRAVDLLPTAAWPGLRRPVREARLEEAPPATDAAARAVRAGDRSLAVELVDAGRAVLWSQQLNLRTDLTRLQAVAPDLAARLDELRIWLDRVE